MIRFYATIFMKLIQIDDQLIAKKKVATGVLWLKYLTDQKHYLDMQFRFCIAHYYFI